MMNEMKSDTPCKIVNIASFTAMFGCKNMLAYSAAKASIVNLTKVAAVECSPGVLINSVSPATIDTPLIRKKYDGDLPDYSRGLTLSGTKTHAKQCFLPPTPLLMAADALSSPVLPA
ncbi:SDR family oxidoreductase [Pantoea stewartii]|uniref:SDR family oxidoreductase n=2 Tax=Pantoea stewartii TaxID=66269 RepID=UPI000906E988|nr:SDR family oxidoreductase [Pantoea stewartii subsp. stewartii]